MTAKSLGHVSDNTSNLSPHQPHADELKDQNEYYEDAATVLVKQAMDA